MPSYKIANERILEIVQRLMQEFFSLGFWIAYSRFAARDWCGSSGLMSCGIGSRAHGLVLRLLG